MAEPTALESTFARIADRLDTGDVVNNTTSFGVFRAPGRGVCALGDIVHTAVGPNATIRRSQACGPERVLEALHQALTYRGDEGAHPNRDYVGTAEWRADLDLATRELSDLLRGADLVSEIEFADGHPFYPVFWDFAFVVTHGTDAVVVIGSSSD